ncbi:MAG: hypothetical protein Tsb0026_05140 [Sulfuricaulis sp.]
MINVLLLDGKCIAVQFCLLTDSTLYILKIGYDESHAQIAPGYLLLEQMLRDYIDGHLVHSLSFVTDPPWTQLWRARSLAVYDCTVYNHTARGWLAYLWAEGKLLKRLLSSGAHRNRETIPIKTGGAPG